MCRVITDNNIFLFSSPFSLQVFVSYSLAHSFINLLLFHLLFILPSTLSFIPSFVSWFPASFASFFLDWLWCNVLDSYVFNVIYVLQLNIWRLNFICVVHKASQTRQHVYIRKTSQLMLLENHWYSPWESLEIHAQYMAAGTC
jgi:hypothetical protein